MKTWVMEIHGVDDIRTFNSMSAECDGWRFFAGRLIHQPGDYSDRLLTQPLADRIRAALLGGVFPVDIPYSPEEMGRDEKPQRRTVAVEVKVPDNFDSDDIWEIQSAAQEWVDSNYGKEA